MQINNSLDFIYKKLHNENITSFESELPKRQDYYQVIWLKKGNLLLEIDFTEYNLKDNTLSFIAPCQQIRIKSYHTIEGDIVKFTPDFFLSTQSNRHSLMHFPFFCPIDASPYIIINEHDSIEIEWNLKKISEEYDSNRYKKNELLILYIHALLINSQRLFKIESGRISSIHMDLVLDFKQLVDDNHHRISSVSNYANMLSVTPKYLNEASKVVLGKKASEVISNRIFLEAKRLLSYSTLNVSEVATKLNFNDLSYFTKFFKKLSSGQAPSSFKLKAENNTN